MGRAATKEDIERGERMRALRLRLGLVGREIFPDDPVNSHARVSTIEKGRNRLTGADALLAYARAADVTPEAIAAYRDGRVSLDALLERQPADAAPTMVDLAFLRLTRTDPELAARCLEALPEIRKVVVPPDFGIEDADALIREWLGGTASHAPAKVARRR
jgi:hypothetical protein